MLIWNSNFRLVLNTCLRKQLLPHCQTLVWGWWHQRRRTQWLIKILSAEHWHTASVAPAERVLIWFEMPKKATPHCVCGTQLGPWSRYSSDFGIHLKTHTYLPLEVEVWDAKKATVVKLFSEEHAHSWILGAETTLNFRIHFDFQILNIQLF